MADRLVAVYPQATRLVFTAKSPREAGRLLAEGMQFASERYNAQVTGWKWGGNGFNLIWSDGVKELYYVMWETSSGVGRELTKSERSDFDADFFKVLKG